ncbi:CD164 sialomucin-like 2 protein [Silurus meridionalis]|uniref:CD164 sialomucin-like 2 protein n=1 Tax=Silurus meridionalis TaxID=175797 RepID=UPI001EEA0FB9|nr:CD164 sialomucin-like 2 protein [Silurus meridionalis]
MRCVTVVLCCTVLLVQLMMTNSQNAGECSQLDSCDRCTTGDPALNLTNCVWKSCDNDNNTRCIPVTEDSGDCAVYNDTTSCPTVSESFDESGSDDSSSGSEPEYSGII